MNRKQCKAMLPIIKAFAEGENVEYFDSLQITKTWGRGMWKTEDNLYFSMSVEYYRINKGNNEYVYFSDIRLKES
jgi:hypothetical protein